MFLHLFIKIHCVFPLCDLTHTHTLSSFGLVQQENSPRISLFKLFTIEKKEMNNSNT